MSFLVRPCEVCQVGHDIKRSLSACNPKQLMRYCLANAGGTHKNVQQAHRHDCELLGIAC
eukprot:1154556-Pelagomonas_calceolata.AAC.2